MKKVFISGFGLVRAFLDQKDFYQRIIVILLVGILTVQIMILYRMPPTIHDFKSSRPEQRMAVSDRLPVVSIMGQVEVRGEVEAEISNTLPIPVQIER
ncbi:MAG TPA: hypothetical protein PLO63_13730 [Syntrophales bacterium]|nr:hypothetical protein [Syntrophales bacterium]